MPNENIFRDNVKKFVRSCRKEWASFWAAPGDYSKTWLLARYGQLNFWYNRSRKFINILKDISLWSSLTGWVTERATSLIEAIIQIFYKFKDGKLAELVKEAEEALEKKKDEIRAIGKEQGKTEAEVNKEISQWQSGLKTNPLPIFFKLFGSIFDFTDSLMTAIKNGKKIEEIDARIKLVSAQKKYKDKEISQESYFEAYEKVIRTTRDPLLAKAFLEAYRVTLFEILNPSSEELGKLIGKFIDIDENYKKAIEKAENAKAIDFYDVNLNTLKKEHDSRVPPKPKKFIGVKIPEVRIESRYNKIKDLVNLKEEERVFEYIQEILKHDPLFENKSWDENLTKSFSENHRKYEDEKKKYKERAKKGNESTKQIYAYLKQKNEKIFRLCDLNNINNLENSEALLFKWGGLISAIILMLNAALSFLEAAVAIAALATTGNVSPVIKSTTNLLNTITSFTTEKSITFIDAASTSTFEFIMAWRKWKAIKGHYEAACKNVGNRIQSPERFDEDQLKALQKDQKKSEGSDSELYKELKNLRMLKRRLEYLKTKLIKKNIAAFAGGLMFFASVLSFFFPATSFVAVFFGVVAFIGVPIARRFVSDNLMKKIRENAIELELLPKNAESFEEGGLKLWLYVALNFFIMPIESAFVKIPLLFVLNGVKIIDAIAKILKPNPVSTNKPIGSLFIDGDEEPEINVQENKSVKPKEIKDVINDVDAFLLGHFLWSRVQAFVKWLETPSNLEDISGESSNSDVSYKKIKGSLGDTGKTGNKDSLQNTGNNDENDIIIEVNTDNKNNHEEQPPVLQNELFMQHRI